MKKFLVFFSYLLHPLFIPVIATLFYLYFNNADFANEEELYVLLQINVVTVLVPILIYLGLHSTGKVDSVMIYEISQRKIPLVLQCFLIIFLVRICITIERYPELHFFFLAALFSTLTALLLLFVKIKASLHMMAISALTVFVFGLNLQHQTQNLLLISVLIFLNGIVASSRLEMKAHSPKELVIGFLVGSMPQFLLMYLWL